LLCGMLGLQNLRLRREVELASRQSPHVEHLWRELFRSGRPATIVCSDANLLLLSSVSKRPANLLEYRAQDYPTRMIEERVGNAAVRDAVSRLMGTFLTTTHDSIGLASLAVVMDRYRLAFRLAFARDVRREPDSEDNLILLGNRSENPWVELFDHKVNFAYEWDVHAERGMLRNRKRIAAEKEVYVARPDKSYATVVYAPRPDGSG